MSVIKYRQNDGTYIEMPTTVVGVGDASEVKLSDTIEGLDSETVQAALAALQENKADSVNLGTLKFRIDGGLAQYSKDGGSSWTNFRTPVGTATTDKVLTGTTFANTDSDTLTGTMPNNGAFSGTITEKNGSVTIPEGYHNGSGSIQATYSTGSRYGCFNIGTIPAGSSKKTFDLASIVANINANYDTNIEVSSLAVKNFLLVPDTKSYGTINTSRTTSGWSGNADDAFGSKAILSYGNAAHSISGTTLTINNLYMVSESYCISRDGGSWQSNHQTVGYYPAGTVYLALLP